ncbi:MAG: hypothetical protein U5L45_05090 [Saprospiraceae bacterium]|nr:hypothetical protein [Saprospiraceae bacterium]
MWNVVPQNLDLNTKKMSFNEPIEQRYNDLLKQRLELKGEIALLKHTKEAELVIERRSRYKMLLSLLLLPLFTFVCNRKIPSSVYEHKIAVQRDSIQQLLDEKALLLKTQKDSIRYVIQKGDMLIALGQLFYNDSTAGYQIGKDNGFVTQQQHENLVIGDTLTIRFR